MSKSDSDEPAMTPKQMLEKTVRLYENLVGKSTRLNSKKPEPSSECSSPELNTRKRRKVDKLRSDSDSGSDDFEESPLRKSLSPKSPKNSKKKRCLRNKNRADSRLESSPVRRYKTRTGKAKKRISYADLPEMDESDTDFDSPKGGSEDGSSSSGTDSRSNRERATPRANRRRPRPIIADLSDEDSAGPSNVGNSTGIYGAAQGQESMSSSRNRRPVPIIDDSSEDSAGPSNVGNLTESNDAAQERNLTGEESTSSRRSSRPRPRIDDSTDEGSNVENVTETQPGPASEEQGLGEESEESLEEMIVDRSKKETPKSFPCFLRDINPVKGNSFVKYTSTYYREDPEATISCRMSDGDFISSGSDEEEYESEETCEGKKRQGRQIISSDEEDLPICSKFRRKGESPEKSRDRGKRNKSRSEEEVTPTRRSKRRRPNRHSAATMKGLRKLFRSKHGKGHPDSSPSESDSEDDGRSAAGGPNDDFLRFTQGRNDNDHNPGSPGPGPSGVSENRPGQSGVSENRPGQSGVSENRPGQSGVSENRPGPSGVSENRPGQSGVSENRPGQSGVSENRPGPSGVSENRPGPSGVSESRPGPSGVSESRPGQSGVSENRPGPSGVSENKPGPSGVSENRPGPSGVSENRPGPSGVSENRPGPSGVSEKRPGLSSPVDDQDKHNCSEDADKDVDYQIGVEGSEKSVDGDKASSEDQTEEDSDDTLVGMDEEEMNRILREGKLTELPKDTSPELYPDLLCKAAAISTPRLVGYLIDKFGYDACVKNTDGMAISHAIRAGRADNLLPLLMDMSRNPNRIVYEISKRCARDLVKGDISCLLALEEWQEQSAQGPVESLIEQVLNEGSGRRRIFETLGENFNTMALEHLISLDLETDSYDPATSLFKCLQQTERWTEDEETCAEFVQKLIEHFGREVFKEEKNDLTPLMLAVRFDSLGAVKLLLSLGADPLHHSEIDKTPLHIAALYGHSECAKIILQHDPRTLSESDDAEWTPVMWAVYQDHWETVDLMLTINLSRDRVRESQKLLYIINSLRNRRYGRDYQDAMVKNYAMIMKLIKHVAESDQLRHLLNDLVTSVNDRTLANYILEELMMYPGLVSTEVKVKYIRSRVSEDRRLSNSGSVVGIPRDNFLGAVLSQRRNIEGKQSIWANFLNEAGSGPGVTKEFYHLFSQEIINSHFFKLTEDGVLTFTYLLMLYGNDRAKHEKFTVLYDILGQMMARAILNNIPLGLHLAEYISKYIMDEPKNVMQDFETTDKNLFNSINSIDPEEFKEYEIPYEENVIDPFTGSLLTFPLKSVPKDTFAADKKGYLMLKARKLLYDFPKKELEALKSGFDKIFPRQYKNLLNARELGELVGGETALDLQDWMSNTTHRVPQGVKTDFWTCVRSFNAEDRRALLHFTTGMSFLPMGGFAHLPGGRFTLTQAMGLYRDGRDDNLDSLPTAATCINRLTLPPYSSQESMKKHLLIAIRYGSKGFVFA